MDWENFGWWIRFVGAVLLVSVVFGALGALVYAFAVCMQVPMWARVGACVLALALLCLAVGETLISWAESRTQ